MIIDQNAFHSAIEKNVLIIKISGQYLSLQGHIEMAHKQKFNTKSFQTIQDLNTANLSQDNQTNKEILCNQSLNGITYVTHVAKFLVDDNITADDKKNWAEILKMMVDIAGVENHDDKTTGDTLLHYAARYGNKDLYDFLCAKGCNPEKKNKNSETPSQLYKAQLRNAKTTTDISDNEKKSNEKATLLVKDNRSNDDTKDTCCFSWRRLFK